MVIGATAAIIELPSALNAVSRTVADGTQISGGNLMVLSEPNTVASSVESADAQVWGGVAAAEKVASDGATTMPCYISGVFDMECNQSTAVTVGKKVGMSGANMIRNATEAEVLLGQWIGVAEETGAASEVIRVRLRGY